MLSPQEQMEIIKAALAKGYDGPIYELIDQAIIEKQSQQIQQSNQQQAPNVGTPALGGKMPIKSEPTSTERNIIRPGQYETGGLKDSDPDCKECGGVRKYEDGGNPDGNDSGTNLKFSVSGPMYDLNGKCFANCAQREFAPRHNLSLGSTIEGGSEGVGMGLWGGYTLNPDYGRKQEGFKAYLGANAGGTLSGIKASDFVGTDSDIEPTITPYANAVMTAGYEGETGDGSSYQEYLRGRRGDPLKWGIGAYAKKDLLGNKGFTFGGYGHYGSLNVSGGYNTQTGAEFKAGIGIPIREEGGFRKKYHEGGVGADINNYDPSIPPEHWQEPHHSEQGDGGNNQGSMYDVNNPPTVGESMEWGAGWNMGGPGFGFKTPYGSYNMLPEKPDSWADAGLMLMGPAANLTGLGKFGQDTLSRWFSKEGGVRKFDKGGKKDGTIAPKIPENFDWDNVSEEDRKKYNILDDVEIKRYGIDLTMYKNARQMGDGLFTTPSHGMWPGHLQSRMVHPENASDFGYDSKVDDTHLDYWDYGNRSTYQHRTKTGKGVETSRIYLKPDQMKRYLDYANTHMDASSGGIGSLGWNGYNFLSNNCAGVNCDGLGVDRSGTREMGVVTPERAYYKIKNYDFETGEQKPWRKDVRSQDYLNLNKGKSLGQSALEMGFMEKGGLRYKNGGKKGEKIYPLINGKEMSSRQKSFHDSALKRGMVFDGSNRYFKNQKVYDKYRTDEASNKPKQTHYYNTPLNSDGLVTLDQTQGNRISFIEADNLDQNQEWMDKINSGNWGFNPTLGKMVKLNKSTERQLTKKEKIMNTEEYGKLNVSQGFGVGYTGNFITGYKFSGTPEQKKIYDNLSPDAKDVVDGNAKDIRKKHVAEEMKKAYKNPIMYAPAALYTAAVVGPAMLTAANTPLISGIGGTSLLDIAGAYGGYHAVTHGPEDVKKFIADPSLSTGTDVALDVLGAWGGGSTVSKLFKSWKGSSATKLTNITSNSPTTAKGTVSRNVSNTNEPLVRATSEEIKMIDKGIKEGTKHYKANIIHPENERRLNTMGRWGQQWKQNWNTAVKHQTYKPFQVSGEKASRHTLGQSGNVKSSQMGDRTLIHLDSPHVSKIRGSNINLKPGETHWTMLDEGTAIPRYSTINTQQNVFNLRRKQTFASHLTDDAINKGFIDDIKSTTTHEIHHSIGLNRPGIGGMNANYKLSGSIDDAGYFNQPAMWREGIVDAKTIMNQKHARFKGDPWVDPPSFSTKFNPKLKEFGREAITDSKQLDLLRASSKRSGGSGYDNQLLYKNSTEEITADLIGFRSKFNLGLNTHSKINSSQADDLFKAFKKEDPIAGAMYKDANAFKNMFNKVPYSIVPPALGVGLNIGGDKKTGGYRSNSPRQMLYNNR